MPDPFVLDRRGFEIVPDKEIPADEQIPTPAFAPGPSVERRLRTTAVKDEGYEQVRDQFVPHVRNFIDCVKSRQQPISDLASSHRASVACHLANIAMRVGRVVRWDEDTQSIVGDDEAAALLTKRYRAPWNRELQAALPHA